MLLTKEIIPVNKYKVRTNQGRLLKDFTTEYLTKVAETSNRMLAAGLKIPAPFDHHKEAKPRTQQEQEDFDKVSINAPKTSYNNAGYWQKFWVAPNNKGVLALYGQLDAPGDITDTNSPAYKVNNTNGEVSVSIAENFEDGLSRTWTDGLLHVAVVSHAVVPDQEPFLKDGVSIVNMSMIEPGSTSEGIVEELKAVLRNVKINLPGSTTAETFLRDLLVAASQIGTSTTDNIEPVPIYMSIGDNDMALTEAQAKAITDAKTVNPGTTKPFTMEELGFKPVVPVATGSQELLASLAEKDKTIAGLSQLAGAFKNKFLNDTKQTIQQRIGALIAAGVVTKEWAEATLVPKVEFQMSIVDGQIQDHPLEITLSSIEAIAPKSATPTGNFPPNGVIQDYTLQTEDLSDAAMDAAMEALGKDGLL